MNQQAEISETQERLRVTEQENADMELELEGMRESIEARKIESEREHRKQERLEKEIRELKSTMDQKSLDIKQKLLQIQSSEEQQVPRLCSNILSSENSLHGCFFFLEFYGTYSFDRFMRELKKRCHAGKAHHHVGNIKSNSRENAERMHPAARPLSKVADRS
jgi:chromosome segregation ATPase